MRIFAPRSQSLRSAVGMAALLAVVAGFAPTMNAQTRPPRPKSGRPSTAAEIQSRSQKSIAEFDRKHAEQKRKFDEQRRLADAEFERARQEILADSARGRAGAGLHEPPRPPFDPASAPPPADCLRSFFATAYHATSMEPLLNYLPLAEQKMLQERQARYDPRKAAASRERWKQKQPEMSERELAFWTDSPYAKELDDYKTLAKKFIAVLGVKVEGDKATVTVATNSTAKSGGEVYPYSRAKIELIGEAGYWRFSTYNDSGWYYKDMPTEP